MRSAGNNQLRRRDRALEPRITDRRFAALLYAEMNATFARKRREEPKNADTIAKMQEAFRGDFKTMTRIAIDDDVHRRVDEILARHPLRGADAVHLASAILVHDVLQEQVTFACADIALVNAARAEGLTIAP